MGADSAKLGFPTPGPDKHTAVTPLRIFPDAEMNLADDLRVLRLSDHYAPCFDEWNTHLGLGEIRDLKDILFWISYDYESNASNPDDPADKKALGLLNDALICSQILAPVGARNVKVACYYLDGKMLNKTTAPRRDMSGTAWARVVLDQSAITDWGEILSRFRKAVEQNFVRVINPVRLFQHGLEATEIHIRVLLWTTALDALLMAESGSKFETRLCSFLGRDTLIFPPDPYLGWRPTYTVGEVARDLYTLRGLIAHGKEIRTKFRQEVGFTIQGGSDAMRDTYGTYQYWQVLEECALFLLCATLKKLFIEDLLDEVADGRRWASYLDSTGAAPS